MALFASLDNLTPPKWSLLLKERICSSMSKFFPLKADSFEEQILSFKSRLLEEQILSFKSRLLEEQILSFKSLFKTVGKN